jgi:transglutaminase-like putative cysteine protease/tetratricopeptide (TPR) repeat protein
MARAPCYPPFTRRTPAPFQVIHRLAHLHRHLISTRPRSHSNHAHASAACVQPRRTFVPHAATLALLTTLSLLLTAASASAENPVDLENHKLAERALKAASDPRGVLPLLELWDNWDRSTPKLLVDELDHLAKQASLPGPRRVLIETLRAQAKLRLGDPSAVAQRFEQLGYVTQFRVIGPFDNEGKRGFDTETPVEQKRMEAPDLQATYPGRERPVGWRELPDIVRSGFVPFGAIMRPFENVCGLAETFVQSEQARPLSLWASAGGALKVYWNGEPVLKDAAYRGPSPDRSVVMVAARKGFNRLLVKVCTTSGAWGFQLRMGDAAGGIASGLRYAVNTPSALEISAVKSPKLPAAPLTPLAYFEQQASLPKPAPDVLADYARYLDLTNSDDPAERKARQIAEWAAELAPSADHYRLAAKLVEERAEIMRLADKAAALAPNDPSVMLLEASVIGHGPSPEQALPLLDRIPPTSVEAQDAQLLRAHIIREIELPSSALAVLQAFEKTLGGPTVGLLRDMADLAGDASQADEAQRDRARLLALRFDDSESRRGLIDDALARGDKPSVLEHLDALRSLTPGSLRTLLYVADVYDALGRDDLVLATYRDAQLIAPDASGVYLALGRALLRAQQSDAAYQALQKALALKPQDAETRELLEEVRPVARADEAYAVPSSEILSRRQQLTTYPYSVLEDLTVKTVFDNGLGSTFKQLAVEIHDQEGARRFRTHGFQYDPDSQRVDLRLARVYRKDGRELESVRTVEQQLGEPWYRVYYDTRAVQVVFPDLEPGDVVELRYRIDDVAHRNLFADYFGDLELWQDYVPVNHKRYVLITPASREIYQNPLAVDGLTHTQKIDGKRRIDDYAWSNVPVLLTEDAMPGITEESPYLHVSTYKSWQDVGQWYWGLIRDQLYADQALKRTVAELIAGKTNTKDKVISIHDWVVNHTRYVGLEFGIHGFLPYRVPLIVQRGFGDCKDKASLMYTMLREAGVDARIVLLRTRHNGAIASTPASLAVFDHAITYVPELDLYLDGTAEHSGTTELPSEDQGVSVLLVGPQGAEFRTTPIMPAAHNLRTRGLSIALESDGSARVEGKEEVVGSDAAGYRQYYEAEGTRAERFERTLGTIYPGVELISQNFDSLQQLESPVRYAYRIRVPRFGRFDGDTLQVAPSVLTDLIRNMARAPSRQQPLDLGSSSTYVEERAFTAPKGMSFSAVPKGGEADSEFGRLRLSYAAQAGGLSVRTEFILKRARVAPGEYPTFRRWIDAADQLLRQRISLSRGAR